MSKQDNTAIAIIGLGAIGLYLFKDKLKESLGGVSTATKGIGEGVSDVFTSAGDLAGVLSAELSKAIRLPSRAVEGAGNVIHDITETAKNTSETAKIRAGADRETLILDVPRAVTEGSLRQGKLEQAQASLAVADLRSTGVLPPAQISLGSVSSTQSIRSPKEIAKNIFNVTRAVTQPVQTITSFISNKLRGN